MSEKRQKKILQVITKSNFGGAQKYVYELSSELNKKGYEVVVAFGGSGLLKEKLDKENIRTIEIESLQRDINFSSDIKSFFELIKIIRREKPDVVHLNSSKIGALGSLAARILFVPKIIFTIHGLAFNENRGFISKIIIKKIYFMTVMFSHYSIAVSKNTKKQFLQIPLSNFFLESKIKVIKNAIQAVNFIEKNEAIKFIEEKINKNLNDKKIVGTVAELHHIKGINYLIDSAKDVIKENNETIFVVFGDGEERNNLEKQIKENGLENNFYLLGYVENASKYLKAFDLFVLPSLSEGLALVLLEARQADIKIVASNTGGIPEALEHYENSILFETKNTQDLKSKILLSLKNPQEFKNDNDSILDFNIMVEKTLELYLK